jgi:Spy/CpxP family protein refolding chaperone
MGPERALLRGITLTEAQKAKLHDLQEAQRAEMKQGRGENRPEMEAIRAARESGDTAKVRQLMQAQRATMDARRDKEIASIRSILTSDQLAAFDANVAEMKKREGARGAGRGGRGAGRGRRPPV